LPENGKFLVADWAEVLGMTEETVKEYVKGFGIRTLRAGNLMVVDAAWWWQDIARGVDNGDKRPAKRKP
jgi:hypothetical protein